MRIFFRYLVAISFQFVFAAFLLLLTIRFQILDPNFLITSFRNADVYKQSAEIFKEYLGESVEVDLRISGIDKLPIEQQEFIENEILQLTSAVEEDEVKDFIETNIYRFYRYMNSETASIILYFPIRTWGLPDLVTSQEPFSLLTENTTLETMLGQERARKAMIQLSQAREYIKLIRTIWFIPLILSLLLLITHYLLSKSPQRIKPSAWLLIVSGIYTLLMCGTAYIGSNEFVNRTASYGEPILLMMGTIIPHLFLTIIYLWAKIAGGLIATGLLILIIQFIVTKRKEREEKKRENSPPQPTSDASTQPLQQNQLNPTGQKVGENM